MCEIFVPIAKCRYSKCKMNLSELLNVDAPVSNRRMHHGYMHHRYMHHGHKHHDTCIMNTCIMETRIKDSCIIDICIIDSCIIAVEVEKEELVNFAWVTRPERPKGVKDGVKRPVGPPPRSQGPEGP